MGYQEKLLVKTNTGRVIEASEVDCATEGMDVDVVDTRARGYVGVRANFQGGERAADLLVDHPSGTLMGIK